MDNYRVYFKAKTDTFKANYCNTVDNYADLVLRQIEAITNRTGDESPRELSRMIKHMEDTNTLYLQQLNLLSGRYFAGKAAFSSSVFSSINDSTSAINTIFSPPNLVDTFAGYYTSNQRQQANNITKNSGVVRIDHPSSTNQFGVQFTEDNKPNTENTDKLSSTEIDPKCDCEDCQAEAIRDQAESDLVVTSKFGNSTVGTSPSGDNLHPIEIDCESESDTEVTKMRLAGGRARRQPGSVPTALKRKWSSLGPSSAGTSILASPDVPRKRSLVSSGSGTLSIDAKRLRGVLPASLSHTCSVCDLSFPSESLLVEHELNEHTTQQQQQEVPSPFRPFACERCDKTFTQKAYLSSHMRVHSGLKTARCAWPGCSFDSPFKTNVITHIRMVHFKLPQTKKKQSELNIVDDRDPKEYVEMIQHVHAGN